MKRDFEWPFPAHFEPIPHAQAQTLESRPGDTCHLLLADGQEMRGALRRLDLEAGLLEYTPQGAAANHAQALGGLKLLRLSDPVSMRRSALPPSAQASRPAPKQKCRIEFADGDVLEAETAGFVQHAQGLFLYLVNGTQGVARCFIPAGAMKNHRIGKPLGKILVEEKLASQYTVNLGLHKQEALRAQKLGEYLQREQSVSREQIEKALQKQRRMPNVRLGQALLQENLVTRAQLDTALALQARDRQLQLGEILIGMQVVPRDIIRQVLAQKLGIPVINLGRFEFDRQALQALPAELMRRHQAIPLYRGESRLVVAMENPFSTEALKALAFFTRQKIDPVMASAAEIEAAIRKYFGNGNSPAGLQDLLAELALNASRAAPEAQEGEPGLLRLLQRILEDARECGASDIHFEALPGGQPLRVRFRRDGSMTHYADIPAAWRNGLVKRLKVLGRLDPAERRRGQEGKLGAMGFATPGLELRLICLPTADGLEDVVLHILAAPRPMVLEQLGLPAAMLAGVHGLMGAARGLVLVCGPAGAGKTTSLHAMLGYINTAQRKIWTVEDRIEISQDGLRQMALQEAPDWDYPAAMKTLLRADPDAIMVGQVRNRDAARALLDTALSGPLLLAGMQAESAAAGLARLLDFGLDPFNLADVLAGVLGQRLLRRLCECSQPYRAGEQELQLLAQEYCAGSALDPQQLRARWQEEYGAGEGGIQLRRACGCALCQGSGYRGRVGVFELLGNSPALRRLLQARAGAVELRAAAIQAGLPGLRQDGIEKVLQGLTDWEQARTLA